MTVINVTWRPNKYCPTFPSHPPSPLLRRKPVGRKLVMSRLREYVLMFRCCWLPKVHCPLKFDSHRWTEVYPHQQLTKLLKLAQMSLLLAAQSMVLMTLVESSKPCDPVLTRQQYQLQPKLVIKSGFISNCTTFHFRFVATLQYTGLYYTSELTAGCR